MMTNERRPLDGFHIARLTASASRLGGRVSTVVPAPAKLIGQAGGRVTVVTLEDRPLAQERSAYGDATAVAARIAGPAVVGFAPALPRLLDEAKPTFSICTGSGCTLARGRFPCCTDRSKVAETRRYAAAQEGVTFVGYGAGWARASRNRSRG